MGHCLSCRPTQFRDQSRYFPDIGYVIQLRSNINDTDGFTSARASADPTSSTGLLSDAQERTRISLERLTKTFSDEKAREKIVYLQISDGSRKIPPQELKEAAAKVSLDHFLILATHVMKLLHRLRTLPPQRPECIRSTNGRTNGDLFPQRDSRPKMLRLSMAAISLCWRFVKLS